MERRIPKVRTDLNKLRTSKEAAAPREKEGGCDEVLRRCDDWLPVSWRHEIMLHAHQRKRLGPSFLRLRHMHVHFITVKVCVVRTAHTFVKAECAPWSDLGAMTHDRQLVQTWLSVEQDNIAIADVALHDVADTQVRSDVIAHARELEETLEPVAPIYMVISAGVGIGAVPDRLAHSLDVVGKYALWVREDLGDSLRHGNFVDRQVRIRRNDCAAGEVDALATKIATETTLLALEPLTKAANWLVTAHGRHTRHLRVDVQGDTQLKKIPLLNQLCGRCAFAAFREARLDDVVGKDDFCELDSEVIFIRGTVLSDTGPNAHRGHANVLPDVLFWPTELGLKREKLAVFVRDTAEQVQYTQGIQIFLRFAQVRRQFAITHTDGCREGFAEFQLFLFGLFLPKLLVDNFQDARLLNSAICRAAVWAI